jgi:hypothetical protein
MDTGERGLEMKKISVFIGVHLWFLSFPERLDYKRLSAGD